MCILFDRRAAPFLVSEVDRCIMVDQAIQRSNSKYAEINRLPLPPQLETAEHE
jgi:hypothetical protein